MFTSRELEVLDFIKSYQLEKRVPPRDHNIADHFNFSRQTGNWYVQKLERKGAFTRVDGLIPWLH